MNHLSDWTEDELRGLTSGYKRDDFEALPTQVPFDEAEFEGDDFELPEEFDWRDAQPSVVTVCGALSRRASARPPPLVC